MIRIGVFTGVGRDIRPEPMIIKTEGVILNPALAAKIASSAQVKDETKNDKQI